MGAHSQLVEPFFMQHRNSRPKYGSLENDIERDRCVPPAIVNSMKDAKLFTLWLARAFGGPELSITEYIRVIEEISRVDGSVGWCCMLASSHSRFSGYFEESVAREIFGDGRTIIAGTINPVGRAISVPGGFRLSGHWTFASFIRYADWVVAGAFVYEGEAPRRDANGAPDGRFLFLPANAIEIIDTWHVSGLRGTGSNDFKINDLFVPENHVISIPTPKPTQPGAIYAAPLITVFCACIAAVALGIVRAAIDAFIEVGQTIETSWVT